MGVSEVMRGTVDSIRLELYADGEFQGYVKSVSKAKESVESTMSKYDSKPYSSQSAAEKDIKLIDEITRGNLKAKVG